MSQWVWQHGSIPSSCRVLKVSETIGQFCMIIRHWARQWTDTILFYCCTLSRSPLSRFSPLLAGRRATNLDWKLRRDIKSEAAVKDCWSWCGPIPRYSESLLVLGLGLVQLAQMSLVVREQVLRANIEHLPAPDQWHLERRSAGSVGWTPQLERQWANLPLKLYEDRLTNNDSMGVVIW